MTIQECENSAQTYDLIASTVLSKPLEEVQEYIRTKFYDADDIVEFLYLVLSSKGNGILHGPGGFGKSQITKEFLKYYGIVSSTIVGHSSMDVEAILGIPNIEKLTKESQYEIKFEKSVFNIPGVLLLEEFLDVKPSVAASLKDILTEGGYRQGDTFTPSKVGSVIICSNKTPEEVSIDLSTAAFYKERFPYSTYVCWNSFDSSSYMNLYKTVYGDEVGDRYDDYKLLSDLCALSCTSDSVVSPRVALKARDALITSNKISSLQYINALDYSKIESIKIAIKTEKFLSGLDVELKALLSEINAMTISNSEQYSRFIFLTTQVVDHLQSTNLVGDIVIKTASTVISAIKDKQEDLKQDLLVLGRKSRELDNLTKITQNVEKYLLH